MIRKYLFLFVLVTFLSVPVWAQESLNLEVGLKGGVGGYGYIDDTSSGNRGVLGLEMCAFCAGKYALFGDYDHWFKPSNDGTNYRSADSFAGGLRIQGRRNVRPFFDIGVAVGRSRFGNRGGTTAGGAFGAGLRIPLGESVYLRPQLRIQVLSYGYVAASTEVAVGWRF